MKIRESERGWYATLGRRIAAAREARGISQCLVAIETGLRRSRVCRIERGAPPTLQELAKLRAGVGRFDLPPALDT